MGRILNIGAGAILFIALESPVLGQQVIPNTGAVGTFAGQTLAPQSQSGVAALTAVPGYDATEAKPAVYKDRTRGFLLVAPPGAKISERKEGAQIAIQSRRGFAVNLQTGDADAELSNREMLAKLESRYLGHGRPWSQKSSENERIVAGLNAISATYDAGSTRTRVLIVRGAKTDFVFMFFAPASQFDELSTEFNWILTGFRPGPDEGAGSVVAVPQETESEIQPPVRAHSETDISPTGRAVQETERLNASHNVFSEPGYGYTLSFPHQWVLEKPSAFTNVISGPKGTDSFNAVIAVQNVQPPEAASPIDAADKVFGGLKQQLSSKVAGVDFVGEKPVTYSKNGMQLEGRQFVAHYMHGGEKYRKWALVLPRKNGTVAHIWSYTAPVAYFEDFRPVAEGILNSLKIQPEEG